MSESQCFIQFSICQHSAHFRQVPYIPTSEEVRGLRKIGSERKRHLCVLMTLIGVPFNIFNLSNWNCTYRWLRYVVDAVDKRQCPDLCCQFIRLILTIPAHNFIWRWRQKVKRSQLTHSQLSTHIHALTQLLPQSHIYFQPSYHRMNQKNFLFHGGTSQFLSCLFPRNVSVKQTKFKFGARRLPLYLPTVETDRMTVLLFTCPHKSSYLVDASHCHINDGFCLMTTNGWMCPIGNRCSEVSTFLAASSRLKNKTVATMTWWKSLRATESRERMKRCFIRKSKHCTSL